MRETCHILASIIIGIIIAKIANTENPFLTIRVTDRHLLVSLQLKDDEAILIGSIRMTKKILLSIAICLVASTSIAESGLNEILIKLQRRDPQRQHTVLDEALRHELYDFVITNENIPAKDSRRFKFVEYASGLVMLDLNKRYRVKAQNYEVGIPDKNDRNVYRVALTLTKKYYYYRPFYVCKGNNEKKVRESWEKVEKLRTRVSELLQKDRSLRTSNTVVQLWEQIIDECRFVDVDYSLLGAYRWNAEKNIEDRYKFNKRMLQIIADDQVNYDYLYGGDDGLDSLNTVFISNYIFLLMHVNHKNNQLILTKDEIKFIAEDILTKHKEVFNLHNSYYYDLKSKTYDQSNLRDAVSSLVNLSTWLRKYGLTDLNDKIILTYFNNDAVIDVIKYDSWFKEFWDYYSQRPDEANKPVHSEAPKNGA